MAITKYISPSAKQQFFDLNGDPLVGGLVYTYVTGSSTPATTYTSSQGTGANTNPVQLDSRGEADIWLTPGTLYRYILKTSAGVEIWTVDDIEAGSFEDLVVRDDLTVGGSIVGGYVQWFCFKQADETNVISTGTAKATYRPMPAGTIVAIMGGLVTASSSGSVILDVNLNGQSILGNRLLFDVNETTTLTASTQPTLVTTAVALGDTITIDYDSVGTDAAGPMVLMAFTPTPI